MLVRATKFGFHGSRRRPGDVFEVPDGSKAKWFEPAAGPSPAKPAGRGKVAGGKDKGGEGEPRTFSEMARRDSKAMGEDATGGLV